MGGAIDATPTGANGGIGDIDIAPDAPLRASSTPLKDDSETIPSPSRERLLVAIRKANRDPSLVGDLILARDVAVLLFHVLGRMKTDKP